MASRRADISPGAPIGRGTTALLLAALLVAAPAGPLAAERPEEAGGNWLLVVRSDNGDPAREAEFNAWYDKVDIPDVLAVDGYVRARRGVRVREPQEAASGASEPGDYVALYDIRTAAIDRAIVDMFMAARKMDKAGRSTDLLRVVEGVYYGRYLPESVGDRPSGESGGEYLLLAGMDCGDAATADRNLADWHDRGFGRPSRADMKFSRATVYKKYRVLTSELGDIGDYLLVVEFKARSKADAIEVTHKLSSALFEGGGPCSSTGASVTAREITDVSR